MSKVFQVKDSSSFDRAKEKEEWQDVMNEVMHALLENETWALVPRNDKTKVIEW